MERIEPKTLKGFRDYLPKDQIARQAMLEKIRQVFERFGFEPLETPVLEYRETLTGKYGDEGEKLLYSFKDQGERDVAMRYDLTVPLARVVAQYQNELPRPFKRYQIAPVWRADKPQKGRYREFYQCDADIVGAPVGIADAECIAVTEQILLALGIRKFAIKVNNRKILNAIIEAAGVQAARVNVAIREIDKLDKVGDEQVAKELAAAAGLSAQKASGLVQAVSEKISSISRLKAFMDSKGLSGAEAAQGLTEMEQVSAAAQGLGVKNMVIDLSLARGLDYYTSTVFEAVITSSPEARSFGSVAGAGRYDSLMQLFAGRDMPAVGMSVGIDRLYEVMQVLGLVKKSNVVDVLILNMGSQFQPDYLQMLGQLRSAGINSEVYYQDADLKKQFDFAEAKSIPFAIIYGDKEADKKRITLRDLRTRKQKTLKRAGMAAAVKKTLEGEARG
ncbi:histidine--tRNA ligase [Patescibacteria group bacterium]|nr:histidine--tRNA ligase [Patescibacteria group bacterium]